MVAAAVATKTVVIAYDTASVRDRFGVALQGAGHHAVAVRSAAELLARVRADLPQIDLLVLSLRLPHSSGVELVRGIRKLDGGRLPILVFSGTVQSADEIRDLATLGVSGYVNEHSAVQQILPSLAPHLFPDNFNRRASPRVALGTPIAYRFGDTVAAALTLNLGKGGVAVRTMNPLEPHSKARLRFRLPGLKREVDADAHSVWSDRRVGMGLQFERLDAIDQRSIDDFLEAKNPPTRKD